MSSFGLALSYCHCEMLEVIEPNEIRNRLFEAALKNYFFVRITMTYCHNYCDIVLKTEAAFKCVTREKCPDI